MRCPGSERPRRNADESLPWRRSADLAADTGSLSAHRPPLRGTPRRAPAGLHLISVQRSDGKPVTAAKLSAGTKSSSAVTSGLSTVSPRNTGSNRTTMPLRTDQQLLRRRGSRSGAPVKPRGHGVYPGMVTDSGALVVLAMNARGSRFPWGAPPSMRATCCCCRELVRVGQAHGGPQRAACRFP